MAFEVTVHPDGRMTVENLYQRGPFLLTRGEIEDTLLDIVERHNITCPDHATQQYAERAHADVLFLLDLLAYEGERYGSEEKSLG